MAPEKRSQPSPNTQKFCEGIIRRERRLGRRQFLVGHETKAGSSTDEQESWTGPVLPRFWLVAVSEWRASSVLALCWLRAGSDETTLWIFTAPQPLHTLRRCFVLA